MSKHVRDKSKEDILIRKNLSDLGLLEETHSINNTSNRGTNTVRESANQPQTVLRGSLFRQTGSSSGQGTSRFSRHKPNSAVSLISRSSSNKLQKSSSFSKSSRTPKSVAFSDQPTHDQTTAQFPTMLNSQRARSRRERTFVGGECAACEELLEHTLQGERVLQFSCGHVAHEACFYEYIKDQDSQYCPTCDAPLGLDSARGGSILDLSKLSNMVRSIAQQNDPPSPRTTTSTPMPWDRQTNKEDAVSINDMQSRMSHRDHSRDRRDSRDSQRIRMEKLGVATTHSRNNSGNASSTDYTNQDQARKHDYDLHAMETTVTEQPIKDLRTTVPAPIVTVRSEFPTLNRSNQQQSLTCLVTIEVPEARRKSNYEDGRVQSLSPTVPQPLAQSFKNLQARPVTQRHFIPQEPQHVLDEITTELHAKVDNWHGLEVHRFGSLKLYGTLRVGKDRNSWQELECYLFGEMLICVKEKKNAPPVIIGTGRKLTRCTLKGSILIKRHLKQVQAHSEDKILTLNLSVQELPTFHLAFSERSQLDLWQQALNDLHEVDTRRPTTLPEYEPDTSGTDDDDYARQEQHLRRVSSAASSYGGPKSATTAPTEYSSHKVVTDYRVSPSLHTPLDLVVVIPVSSSMQGLKISLLKDTLRFLVGNLGERDRMGLVTFGSSHGGVPLVGMTTKNWTGWNKVLSSIRPIGQKSMRADVVDGANVAMDLLMQRKAANPISTIMLISDSSTSDSESVNFVVQRAEAAKVGIYSFGLGLTHKPDSMIELSSRTKSSYLYVKDWMMLRECVAGCLGSLQATSHLNAKLRLKLPEGSPAKFVKISGALQTTKRATGREAEATLGDLRFGDKRDVLVQLVIEPDHSAQEQAPQDHWESIVSGLEALGGSAESDDQRTQSVEELPLLQADLSYNDMHSEGLPSQSSRPSLLTITMLPATRKSRASNRPMTPPIPALSSIVQRRMELLASDMLTRALTLVSRGQHERAHTLLMETRSILKGLAKGGLPPLPPSAAGHSNKRATSTGPPTGQGSPRASSPNPSIDRTSESDVGTPVPRTNGVDHSIMNALDADIEASLEWINHPAVFSRDSRKAVLQAIGVISSQRAYTFRTSSESMWAERIGSIKQLVEASREWHETTDDSLAEEQ